jgi:hypothetical protein
LVEESPSNMMSTPRLAVWFLVVTFVGAGGAQARDARPRDEAARGMDLFVHAPAKATARGRLSVQVRVMGFPTVSTLAALPGARVEAAWDPESLGALGGPPPPKAVATCDEGGRARLDVEVPAGEGKATLLLAAHWRDHERTHELVVERTHAHELELRVSDAAVVPGGAVSAWVFVRDVAAARPAAGATVDVQLELGTEGGAVPVFSRRLVTDAAGMAATRVAVPYTDDPERRWTLTARAGFGAAEVVSASTPLHPREETPGAPTMSAHFAARAALPGSRVPVSIRARDGSGSPIARLAIRYWIGQRGEPAPEDGDAWRKDTTTAVTDDAGAIDVSVEAPSPVSRRGATLTFVARAENDGHALTARDTIAIARPRAELELVPEWGALIPGRSQRLFFHATDGEKALAGTFALEGHGLAARVRTNARGWGEAAWSVPRDVGAHVPEGSPAECAGLVAATVRVRALSSFAGLDAGTDPRPLCVAVDRDATTLVRAGRPLARAGEALPVQVLGAGAGARAVSVVLVGPDGAAATGAWLGGGARDVAVRLPTTARGPWTISAATALDVASRPDARGQAHARAGSVLVLPPVLPRLVARRAPGGPSARPGVVEIDADLDDGHGGPLPGSVGAVVLDARGGANPAALLALDTRRALAEALGVAAADADGFLEGDAGYDLERWAALARLSPEVLEPESDPAESAAAQVDESFAAVVKSLEGAVYESSGDPERLRDVRVRTGGHDAFNPEMLTLTTEAMETPPVTPGGEPWRLADLAAVDPQVRFDTVARRVTRLKLFRVLSAVRSFVYEERLGPGEPLLRAPDAILRRLVHDDALSAGDLLDPWSRGLAFVRAPGPRLPFLSIVPGWALASAGPDGRFGTADDVRDPFQRVLASNTPYARAVQEDRLVDARFDLRVGDETVEAWKSTLEELTGTKLGEAGEGSGYGDGSGRLGTIRGSGVSGGAGRGTRAIDVGAAAWLPPVRTDARGHVRLVVPLGDEETTWQVVLVGVPDRGSPAVASVEVPVSAPLAVRVDAGASWIVGDRVAVSIAVRNRTDRALAATLRVSASGAVAVVDAREAARPLRIAAHATALAHVTVVARAVDTAALDVGVDAPGVPSDRARHEWQVLPAGVPFVASTAAWVERAATLALAPERDGATETGPGRLVLERGAAQALAAILESLRPERLRGYGALADALEVFERVRAWALLRGGEAAPLAVRARELATLVAGEVRARESARGPTAYDTPLLRRAHLWEAASTPNAAKGDRKDQPDCPPPGDATQLAQRLAWLEIAPRAGRIEAACWSALVADALQQLGAINDPLLLARGLLAVLDRPSQALVAGALADRLRAAAPVRDDGAVVLPAALASDRSARARVMAALFRASGVGARGPAAARGAALWPRLAAERDAEGGYGSTEATRAVVRVLVEADAAPPSPASIAVTEVARDGRTLGARRVALSAVGALALPLSPAAASVRLESSAPGVLARLERPMLRPFTRPPAPTESPLHLELAAPPAPRAGGVSLLQISMRHDLDRRATVVARVPLPPGAALAEPVDGVRQVQGALYIRTSLDSDPLPRIFAVPVRFALAGTVTLPEASARLDDEERPLARAPARALVVAPGP